MSNLTNKQIIEEYLTTLSGLPKVPAIIDQYISDRDQDLKDHVMVFEAGIPHYRLEPQDIVAEGNKVVVRFIMTGRHTGELFGYPPSGNDVRVDGIIIYEMEDGKIVNHWMQADVPALMQQIAAVPAAVSA